MQILVPIQEHNEFDFNILLIAERLQRDTSYVRMSREAYDREPDAFVITRSIACFERTFVSGQSPYDAYFFQGQNEALTAAEKRGMDLFFSEKTNCAQCHAGINFSNYAFENNGLYADYPDPGRFRLTELESDRARFKVPTLRNVELTYPYFHDGAANTLTQAVDTMGRIQLGTQFTSEENAKIVAFLKTLTGDQPSFTLPILPPSSDATPRPKPFEK
jgi:cytochrome c peroxidase